MAATARAAATEAPMDLAPVVVLLVPLPVVVVVVVVVSLVVSVVLFVSTTGSAALTAHLYFAFSVAAPTFKSPQVAAPNRASYSAWVTAETLQAATTSAIAVSATAVPASSAAQVVCKVAVAHASQPGVTATTGSVSEHLY